MRFGAKPSCSSCGAANSPVWKKNEKGEVTCLTCFKGGCATDLDGGTNTTKPASATLLHQQSHDSESAAGETDGKGKEQQQQQTQLATRKSARSRPAKKGGASTKSSTTKGKSRRIVLKKNPIKAPAAQATVISSSFLWYKIRGFLQDQYCEKSAVLTWLIPTQAAAAAAASREPFDATKYLLGPSEDVPRKLECMQFVCHAPADYFVLRTPHPGATPRPHAGYMCARIAPCRLRPPHAKQTMTDAMATGDSPAAVNVDDTAEQTTAGNDTHVTVLGEG
ncbi:PREDICTED: GATA zinc finger domain-containing protein 1-like isoform X2 [Priapulus caudatus]|uniref:GATA zinc finger domain-containing protein 1 n=1 Tax=Priapulus caudatus TaxID=37621 RepID=A0ABM1EJL5_PRICU|nr:PREDICTED: GATA zinc finger domain-containing protein 1-like isoform X2 [Priapulus caudatus]